MDTFSIKILKNLMKKQRIRRIIGANFVIMVLFQFWFFILSLNFSSGLNFSVFISVLVTLTNNDLDSVTIL